MSTYEPGLGETRPLSTTIEPAVGAAYSYAWSLLGRDFVPLLIIGVVAWLLLVVVEAVLGQISGALGYAYQFLIGAPISYGGAYAYLRAVRGQRPEIGDLFVVLQRNWVN